MQLRKLFNETGKPCNTCARARNLLAPTAHTTEQAMSGFSTSIEHIYSTYIDTLFMY